MTNWNNPFHGDYAWYYTPAGGAAHLFPSDGSHYLSAFWEGITYTALCGHQTNQGRMADAAHKITQCGVCFKKQFVLATRP